MFRRILYTQILLLITGSIVFSQNHNDLLRLSEIGISSDAKALGQGNAYISQGGSFGSAFFNPAGLALSSQFQFNGAFGIKSLTNKTDFLGSQLESDNNNTNVDQLGFVMPMPTSRGSLVFAFGYTRSKDFTYSRKFNNLNNSNTSMINDLTSFNDDIPYNLYLSYPVNDADGNHLRDETIIGGKLNQRGDIKIDGSINNWALSGAWEAARNLFLGVSLNIYSGDYKFSREYTESDVNNVYGDNTETDPGNADTKDFQEFYFNDKIDWDISGWDFKLGFLYKLQKVLQVGGTVKFPTKYTIEEKYFVDASSKFGSGTTFFLDPVIDDRLEYKITTPYEFAFGATVKQYFVSLSAGFTYINYSQMEFDEGINASAINDINRDITELYRDVFNLNAGIEFSLLRDKLKLRGGFILQPSAFEGDPKEYDKKYITGGIGYEFSEVFTVDVAYAYGWWKNFADNYGVNDSRTFDDINKNKVLINFIYHY